MKSIDTLMSEHKRILSVMGILSGMTAAMKRNEPVGKDDIGQVFNFLHIFADDLHHTKEESILFPALLHAGILNSGGPVSALLFEHNQGRSLLLALEEAINRGRNEDFVDYANIHVGLQRHHIYKEDYILFPMACDLLTPEDDQEILSEFGEADRKIGEDTLKLFDTMIRPLELRYLDELGERQVE